MRALDGHRELPVARGGRSVFRTPSTTGPASLTRPLAERRITGTFNAADPHAHRVAEIAAARLG